MESKNIGLIDGLRLLSQAYRVGEDDSDDDIDEQRPKLAINSEKVADDAAPAKSTEEQKCGDNLVPATTVSILTGTTNTGHLLSTSTDSFLNYRDPAVPAAPVVDTKPVGTAAGISATSSSDDDSDTDDGAASEIKVSEILKNGKVPSDGPDTDTSDDDGERRAKQLEDKIKIRKQRARKIRTQGEMLLEDLPPVEELHISLPPDYKRMQEIGFVKSIIDTLVIVQSRTGAPALNLDSCLFLQYNVALGRIFDIFGPVHLPCYAVRFNSRQDIDAVGVLIDEKVFFAPELSDLTRFVFPHQLKQQELGKGSDASWTNDNEPPEECIEYSDDEAEQQARRARAGPGARKRNRHGGNRPPRPSNSNGHPTG